MESLPKRNIISATQIVLLVLALTLQALTLHHVIYKIHSLDVTVGTDRSVTKDIRANVTNDRTSITREDMNSSDVTVGISRNLTKDLNTIVTNEINSFTQEYIKYSGNKTCLRILNTSQEKSNTSKILPCLPDFGLRTQSKFVKHDNISLVFEIYRHTKLAIPQNKTRNLIPLGDSIFKHENEYIFSRTSSSDTKTTATKGGIFMLISSVKLVEFVILLKIIYNLSTKIRQNSTADSKDEKKELISYKHIFEWRDISFCSVKVYPFSLNEYINRLEKRSDKNSKCMNNEWARLESFKTFPEDCPSSTLKLAKAGFYSTNNGQEAICFSCGLKNDIWTDTESVEDVHKRLSPDCKFINGDGTENVSIHGDDKQSEGACGGPEDNYSQRTDTEQAGAHSNDHEIPQNVEHDVEHVSSANACSVDNDNDTEERCNQGRYANNIPTEEIRHFPGITNEQPKHPEYAIKSERLSSYTTWTSTDVVKPADLAEAGFFFCGMQDLVRCFFCGGGMKNWEYGDSPWIEHARWFPTCEYLKQCKGRDFINLCQISSMTFPTQNNFQLRALDSEPTTIVADQQIADLNSVAAKRVLDMGYTQSTVENAIKQTRQRIGPSQDLKAQNLLEYLLDNSYTPSAVPTSTSSTPAVQNKTSGNTASNSSPRSSSPVASGKHMSPKEERKLLEEENRCLKEQKMCKVCMDKDANIVFLPCGHLVSCVECAHALRKCAVCRAIIQGTVRTYAS